MSVLFTKTIKKNEDGSQKDEKDSPYFHFPYAGKVITETWPKKDKDGDMAITLEIEPPNAEKPDKNGWYESFTFKRELLRYKNGYRKLSGLRVEISMERLSWTFCGKNYRITSEGTKIVKIGR